MIIRIFQVRTVPDGRVEFRRFFLETAKPMMEATDGIEAVHFGLPLDGGDPDEFAIVMIWRDLAALEAFVGADWRTPHIAPEEEGVVEARVLHHYALAA